MVRGATKSLVIDLGFLLEGQAAHELPESLIGAFRLNHLDVNTAQYIDTTVELPLRQAAISASPSRRSLQDQKTMTSHSRNRYAINMGRD